MATWDSTARFDRDYRKLEPGQQTDFKEAVHGFVEDLAARRQFRPSLRVKGVQGADGVFEMSWAPDGRATFQYGQEQRPGEPHIIWRRVGRHDIFAMP